MESNLRDIFEASYQNPKIAKQTLENKGYKYDDEFSSPDTKVFIDKDGNPNIVHRGTKRIGDVLTDIKLGLGFDTHRHKEARELTQKVKAKYNKPVTAIGHSLGGQLSETSGADKVITFNKATGIKDIFKKIPKNQIDYRTEKDLVSLPSLFQRGGKKITIETPKNQNVIGAHVLKSFDLSKKKTIQSGNPLKSFFA